MQEQRSSESSTLNELLAGLSGDINRQYEEVDVKPMTLAEWATQMPIMLDSVPFSFDKHEYLIEPYHDEHPYLVERKATQLGITTKAMLKVLHGARFKGYKGILYLFPSRTDVLDFSKSRIAPLIQENPDTIGQWLRETDSAGLKQVWDAFLYLRGMQSRVGLKSIPVDITVFDELDEAPQNMIAMAKKRMSHSDFKEVVMLSNPTIPDYGIDEQFQLTDQRYWLLKCEHCGDYTCMEDEFPDCLREVGGRVIRACRRCKRELNPSNGQWVAKKPDVRDRRGYQYSQLFSHKVDPAEIFDDYNRAIERPSAQNDLTNFYNLTIGVAYVEAKNRLTKEQVLTLCGSEGIAESDSGPCYMGVDQGNHFHVVIGRRHPQLLGQIVHVGVYSTKTKPTEKNDWRELDGLMKRFNVSRCVVDALPEIDDARSFAKRHPGKVFLSFYQEHRKGAYAWNEKDMTVASNRTESLDASHKEIAEKLIVLPRRCELMEEFALHLHNVAKRLEEDEETGSKRYIYKKLGADHFRHAHNYEAMARQYGLAGFFGETDLS